MSEINGLRVSLSFYQATDVGPRKKPLQITLETVGCGLTMGSPEYVESVRQRANEEYELFLGDSELFSEWINQELHSRMLFYFRPGGLINRIPDEERPTFDEVKSWFWTIDKLETVTGSISIIRDN